MEHKCEVCGAEIDMEEATPNIMGVVCVCDCGTIYFGHRWSKSKR